MEIGCKKIKFFCVGYLISVLFLWLLLLTGSAEVSAKDYNENRPTYKENFQKQFNWYDLWKRKRIQMVLTNFGYSSAIDGKWGRNTYRATMNFYSKKKKKISKSVRNYEKEIFEYMLISDYLNKSSFEKPLFKKKPENSVFKNMPKFEGPPHKDIFYKGVKPAQWRKIEELGEPLNCQSKMYEIQNISLDSFYVLEPSDCEEDLDCINSALETNEKVMLREGIYNLHDTVLLNKNVLVGYPGEIVVLNGSKVFSAVTMKDSSISNIIIQNTINDGIVLRENNLVYRLVVGNTGVYDKRSTRGIGVMQDSLFSGGSTGNCVVSAESYNGFNHAICMGCDPEKGGSADGFDAKSGATNITFIDVHGHHNSDHGLDFYHGGERVEKNQDPVIRVFYSSAIYNGFNPFFTGGNGAGWKLDGDHQILRENDYHKGRLVYGSASCYNREHGFGKPGTTRLTFLANDSQETKSGILAGRNYLRFPMSYWGNSKSDDDEILKCKSIVTKNSPRSRKEFDIPIGNEQYLSYLSEKDQIKLKEKLRSLGYSVEISNGWNPKIQEALDELITENNWENDMLPSILFDKVFKIN